MSYKTDLESLIRNSYILINEYEEKLRLTSDPIEKAHARKAIEDQWALIKGYLDNYIPLCQQLQLNVSNDLLEIIAHFPQYKIPIPQALEVFLSYAHADEALRNELTKHLSLLKREGLINAWYDREISPGKEWANEIDAHLDEARIILLLVSADFIASDYCYSVEMKQAMQKHEKGQARVIPIILRPCDWKQTPFGRLQALPIGGKPITTRTHPDEAFLEVVVGIRKVVEELKITR